MPAVSSLQPDDKATIKNALSKGGNSKILTATVARVFYQKGTSWRYSGVQGGLCLVVDKQRGGVWFKIVDLLGTRGVIWEHELPISSTWSYNQDRGYFHSFPSEEANVAFVFADESEAGELYKKVQGRSKYNKKAKAPAASSSGGLKKKKGGKIDKSLISGPSEGSFKHVAHMGYTSEKGFSSSGVDPSWQALLDQLGSQGISQKQIQENEGFIREFVQGQGGLPPPQPKKRAPPPAPTSKRKAPPPPPPSRTAAPAIASPVEASPVPPTLPPPRAVPQPPPPPSRNAPPPNPSRPPSAPPAPPRSTPAAPPPAMPPRGGPPPPPPPPPLHGAPPPPTPSAMDLPTPPPGRANLLASIQGAGLGALRKTAHSDDDEPSSARSPPPPPPRSVGAAGMGAAAVGGAAVGAAGYAVAEEASSGGGDDGGGGGGLAGALAAALNQRKGDLGNSDDEESDDEWD